ncbi:16S rRNA (uracil(1498)-N(3))-methyltransferase [Paeniglutamicibacter cryotolerans]|uniref:Ribosomal RNA small subunit methyltransferase E n=1 Tax=Paeniglutamicibacter cryotolerans TaxID=670079 RepID=A0A839QLS0_9MICC|nr:16S rRNA (uracil(1498)-N(3))-methyltransferase [Paeniglutamicibacter cryotolerans]MBB2997179.1 16S rRNA (uracil1498-N3)-methyltransferase [Paeniglutamicibacter cryotolerans]
MSNQAFFTEPGTLAAAAPGDLLSLEGPEGHHAVSVKRVRAGEHIDLLDGSGRRAVCTVDSTTKAALVARVDGLLDEPRHGVRVTLVQALAKGDRDLQAVESAVELGVDAIRPWAAERCVVKWAPERAAKARAKWSSTIRAAVKQSRRTVEPELFELAGTAALAQEIAAGAAREVPSLTLILHEASDAPLAAVLGSWLADHPALAGGAAAAVPLGRVELLVGPEGGISDAEIGKLTAAGARVAQVGTHVLRSSTAGPAALVLVRHLLNQLEAPASA